MSSNDEDNTVWPSEEIQYQQLQWSIIGRRALTRNPGLLIQPNGSSSAEFEVLPYVLVDGSPELDDQATEEEARQYTEHAFNAYVTRATDSLVFGTPNLNRQGLPYRNSSTYENYLTDIGDFFHSSFHCPCPPFVSA